MSAQPLSAELIALRTSGGALAALSELDLLRLASEVEPVQCAAGELLLRAGAPADEVYIVLEGRLEALAASAGGAARILNEMGPGELVGEVALVVGGSRNADVRAATPARLARLSRAGFDRLLLESPETWRRVTELVLLRLRRFELLPYLHRLFGPFESSEADLVRELEAGVEYETLKRSATLFRQGEAADAAYIVLGGSLRVVAERPRGGEEVLHEASRGELVGETALLTDDSRSATVYAVRDSELAKIPRSSFLRLIERRPQTAMKIAHGIIARLKRGLAVDSRQRRPVTCIGLLPASGAMPLAELARELAAGLAAHGSVALLTSAEVDAALGRAGIAQAAETDPAALRLSRWLHEQQQAHRYVVYRADPEWTRWSERCARETDHVVTIADGATAPELGDIEGRLTSSVRREREPERTLLLLHPASLVRPAGTARWLALRDVDEVYHLRRDPLRQACHAGDLARVVRLLAGRALGLVFGGGGARGFAHLGVLRALEELGVPVDRIGGTSIGAPVALPAALGLDAAAGLALIRDNFSSLLDYTLPLASLISGRRISRALERHTGGLDIEDLWLPYFCVSTNLTTAESVVHRRGNLARAVRASVSIPGVMPPVPMGADLLVDGGVLNNLPIDVMRGLNPHGPVLAIDVSPPKGPGARVDFGLAVSGWGLALDRLQPWKRSKQVPALAAAILHSQVVAASRARQRMLEDGLADFYRNIHVRGVGILDFDQVTKVANLGYQDSIGPLRDWVASGARERA